MIKKIQWMVTELQQMSKNTHPSPIHFDKHILSMILQVLIKQLPKRHAPLAIESLMKAVDESMDVGTTTSSDDDNTDDAKTNVTKHDTHPSNHNNRNTIHNDLQPDSVLYMQLLHAWMDSELPETPSKIDAILDDMKIRDIPLDNAIYSILIRYWGNQGSLTRIRAVLERMEYEHVIPNVATLGQVIYGYTRSMQPLQAVSLLEQMHAQTTGSSQDVVTITACTLNILDAFKRLIVRGNDVNRNVIRAEDVVRRFASNRMLKSRSDGTYIGCVFISTISQIFLLRFH